MTKPPCGGRSQASAWVDLRDAYEWRYQHSNTQRNRHRILRAAISEPEGPVRPTLCELEVLLPVEPCGPARFVVAVSVRIRNQYSVASQPRSKMTETVRPHLVDAGRGPESLALARVPNAAGRRASRNLHPALVLGWVKRKRGRAQGLKDEA